MAHTQQTIQENLTTREAVGIFQRQEDMRAAINELETSGFERRQISMLGNDKAVADCLEAHNVDNIVELSNEPSAPRSVDVKEEEIGVSQGLLIGGGMLAGVAAGVIATFGVAIPAMITTAAISGVGGTALGSFFAKMLGEKYAGHFEKQIEQGGILLWVNVCDAEQEKRACDILRKHHAQHVEVHDIQRLPNDVVISSIQDYMLRTLAELRNQHSILLTDDSMMSDKIQTIHDAVEHNETSHKAEISQSNQDTPVKDTLHKAIAYAEDMARERQRVIAESHNVESGAEQDALEQYFAIAKDLKDISRNYTDKLNYIA